MIEQKLETKHSLTKQLLADELWPESFTEGLKDLGETKQQYLDRVRPLKVKSREAKQETSRLFTANAVVCKAAKPFIEIISDKLAKFNKVKVIVYVEV